MKQSWQARLHNLGKRLRSNLLKEPPDKVFLEGKQRFAKWQKFLHGQI